MTSRLLVPRYSLPYTNEQWFCLMMLSDTRKHEAKGEMEVQVEREREKE